MKLMKYMVFTVIFLLAGIMSASAVEITELDVEFDIDIESAYVWRGMIFNDEPVIQPSINFAVGNFSLDVWGTWDLTDVPEAASRTRMDVTLDYSMQTEWSLYNIGLVSYIYQDSSVGRSEDTFEAMVGYTLDVLGLPSFNINYDFAEVGGVYATYSMAHSFQPEDIDCALDIQLAVSGGDANYVDYYFNSAGTNTKGLDASLLDFEAKVSFPYTAGEHMIWIPAVRYMMLIDSKVKDVVEQDGGDTDEIIYSFTFVAKY